ncbi:hypothetical protein BH11MYX1_BH11MYX1_14450 [soil metagenome]
MLEQMRKQGASIFVYLIFCLLIAIFVINFRPGQSRNDDNGCRGTSNVVISVDGEEATQTAYKMAFSSPYNWGQQKQKAHIALETLIRRELLASEAQKRGLIVTDDLVLDEIKKGTYFSATPPPPAQALPPGKEKETLAVFRPIRKVIPGVFDENGLWSLKAFTGFVEHQLNVSRNAYIEEQKHSMLAAMMAQILEESVAVSREEALSQFIYEGSTVTYDVVAFKPEQYRTQVRATDADVDRYLKDHEAEVQARYKSDERTYKATKPALKLRQIFIAKAADAPKPADVPKPADAGSGAGSGSAAAPAEKKDDKKAPVVKPVGMPIEAAKKALEAVKAASKEKFIAAAKELNTEDAAKVAAGDIGWHSVENAALGDKVLNDAVNSLKPGEMTAVLTTDRGAFLILVEDKREGDLSFDKVQRELAWEMAKDLWAKEAAKRAAIAGLEAAKGKKLDDVFEKAKPEGDGQGITPDQLQQLLDDPNTPEQTKVQIRNMLNGMGGAHGAREVHQQDVPAGWFEAQAGAAGSATGSAATSGVGSAGSVPAPLPTAPAAAVVASSDVLPTIELVKQHTQRYFSKERTAQMPGIGQSKEAISELFENLQPGQLGPRVYEADGGFVIVQLAQRPPTPLVTDFDKEADKRVAELRQQRADAFLDTWLRDRCQTLAKANKIHPNKELLTERDDAGKVLPVTYRPCMTF